MGRREQHAQDGPAPGRRDPPDQPLSGAGADIRRFAADRGAEGHRLLFTVGRGGQLSDRTPGHRAAHDENRLK